MIAYLHRATAGAAVGSRQKRRSTFGGTAAGQQVVQQRRRPGADERMKRGHGEDVQLVQDGLCVSGHMGHQRLQFQPKTSISRFVRRTVHLVTKFLSSMIILCSINYNLTIEKLVFIFDGISASRESFVVRVRV